MPKLTAMVLTLNEELRLPECLERLQWADEILVVDSFSKDNTVALAKAAGARVEQHKFEGFAQQINWGSEQAKNEWVLMVDADELVTPELRDSIRRTLADAPDCDVYDVIRDAFFLERPMRSSSWSNDRIPRLYKRGKLVFTGTVHPKPLLQGLKIGVLRGKLLHHTYESIEHYFEKTQKYSSYGAKDDYAAGRRIGLVSVFLGPFWRFFHNYFLRGEILDGKMGLLSSGLAASYAFIKYAKLWGLEDAAQRKKAQESKQS